MLVCQQLFCTLVDLDNAKYIKITVSLNKCYTENKALSAYLNTLMKTYLQSNIQIDFVWENNIWIGTVNA